MLRATENETEQKLRKLRKDNPNYDVMWNRIRLEADKRSSGWEEQPVPTIQAAPKKRWIMPAACAALAAVIAVGAAASQGYLESRLPEAQAAPLGQSVGAQAEADGIILKVNSAVQGKDRSYGQDEPIERMMLDFSLSGFGDEDIRYAAFDQSSITDLDTGKKLELNMGDFNTNDVRSLADWAEHQTLNTSGTVTGDFNPADGRHRYRLEVSGLYMIHRVTVPIEGTLRDGQEYTVLPDRDFKMKVTDIQWDQKQQRMTVKFLQGENKPKLDTQDLSTLAMDRSSMVSLELGDQDLGPTAWREGADADEVEGEYKISGLTQDQIADMTMTFTYAEPVRVIEGPWTVDFTLDSSKAEIPTETVPVEDASALTAQTGWTLGDAQLDAYGVAIPIYRNTGDAGLKAELKDGQIVEYGSITITDGEVTAYGSQDPVPGTAVRQQRADQQEFVKFGIQGLVKNGNENRMTHDFWESYDFRNKTLTAMFDAAWVAHVDPDRWTSLSLPVTEEKTATDTLKDGTQVQYTVHRKGQDVLVEVEVPEGVNLYEGTRLRVDGRAYAYDTEPSEESSARTDQGDYNRVDVYRNVPEGGKFEINMLAYGTVDPTKSAKVVIRK